MNRHLQEPRTRHDGSRQRRFAVTFAVMLVTSVIVAAPALAGGKNKQSGTTTTTTTTTAAPTTTTTLPPDSGGTFTQWEDATALTDYGHGDYPGSMHWVTHKISKATTYWDAGYTGAGIDIALIDTGVVPVDGLRYPGKVINGPDLSFESQADNLRYLDTYGHGTHLAGIIAGRADLADPVAEHRRDVPTFSNTDYFVGLAPEARIVNVKVADSQGAVDVSQVIAAIDWVVQHRQDQDLDIRVIALAYGTDGLQPYELDPLAHAIERAWRAGIVVVVAAGNDGSSQRLRNPATNPFVIAVGASETAGEKGEIFDDIVPAFSNCSPNRPIDLVAPGKSIVSLRNPGSHADTHYPTAAIPGADAFFLGSGTSQAAAVVAGSVALILDQRPGLNPDQVKALLTSTATELVSVPTDCQGAGVLNLAAAFVAPNPDAAAATQTFTPSTGTGTLEGARGSAHIYDEGVALEGEIDIMASPWVGYCTAAGCTDTLWNGGDFNGASWSGASWSGASWSGASWSGASWSGSSWSGASWSSKTWSGASWSGASWSGASWSGASWSGASWSGSSWSGLSWD